MKDLRFVSAKPSDLDNLIEFEKICFSNTPDRFSRKSLRHLMTTQTCKTILIKNKSQEIVGEVIGLLRHFKIPSGRIYKIATHPQLRKKGVGSELVKRIEQWFRKEKMLKTCAEVRIANKASRKMFENNHYKHTKTISNYYEGGEDMTKYWKKL